MPDMLPDVRILPMDPKLEFDGISIKDLQDSFFLRDLLEEDRPKGRYRYRKTPLKADPGTRVLFQYHGRLVALATLLQTKKYRDPIKQHHGEIIFDVESIEVFEPITLDVVQEIWPNVKRFSRIQWKLDPTRFADFRKKLKNRRKPNSKP